MNFRRAKETDFDRITEFYRYSIAHTPGMAENVRWVYGQHPTDAMILRYLSQEAMILFEDEDTIIGAMAVTMSQAEDYHAVGWGIDAEDDEVAVVHILCVHPEYQKQGLGKKLVQESILLARSAQKKAVRLDALACNTPAHRLYQALGFTYRGKQHLYADNTGWTDFLFFEYLLTKK